MNEVTRILNSLGQGNAQAAEELLPLVYDELRLLAAQKLKRERPGQTLQATALVHEAYIRLVGEEIQDWKGRRHFFTAAAEAMRRILIDNARRRNSLKHGGEYQKIEFDESILSKKCASSEEDLIALDEALVKLSAEDVIRAEVVKLRYFAGLTVEQTAEVLGISPPTVKRYWAYARAWLLREIEKK